MTKTEKRTAIILLIIVIIGMILLNNYTEAAVAECISKGVDSNVCEELRK